MSSTTPMRLRALSNLLDLARDHVIEVGGNNRGPMVEKVIKYAKGVVGEPWCVDAVIWAYGHAGSKFMRPGSPRAVRLMIQRGVHVVGTPANRAKVAPGHVVRYSFDHTGLLIGWRRWSTSKHEYVACPRAQATHIAAVEGNTGAGGAYESDSRNGGDGVHAKIRPLSVVQDFLVVTG